MIGRVDQLAMAFVGQVVKQDPMLERVYAKHAGDLAKLAESYLGPDSTMGQIGGLAAKLIGVVETAKGPRNG